MAAREVRSVEEAWRDGSRGGRMRRDLGAEVGSKIKGIEEVAQRWMMEWMR